MNSNLKVVIGIAIFILSLVLFFWGNRWFRKTIKQNYNEFLNRRYIGQVIYYDRYRDKAIIELNGERFVEFFPTNFNWKIEIGDSLFKQKNELSVQIKKKNGSIFDIPLEKKAR